MKKASERECHEEVRKKGERADRQEHKSLGQSLVSADRKAESVPCQKLKLEARIV